VIARLTSLAVVFALVAAGCSSDDATSSSSSPSTTEADIPAAPVEEFTGSVEDFYVVPDPLPAGEPGDLIRTQPIDAPDGQVGLRIMYHSTDVNGDDRAVTGVVYYPTTAPPEGGWPIIASGHGTTGIAEQCAPSRFPLEPMAFGVPGVRVGTDYIGLGPVGEVHSYLSATAEGNAMVDSVVAARNLAEANAGDRWLAVGHSQGGHAALITNEIAADRMPGMELLGTVAIAPGSMFTESYGDDVQIGIITTMVLLGARDEHPDVDPADYLNAEALAAGQKVTTESCLDQIINVMLPFAASPDFYVQDPRTDDGTGREWLEANDPAQQVSESPLLLVQGGKDGIVVPARTEALFAKLCEMGQVVDYIDLPDADHATEPAQAADQITTWFTDRLAGKPAPNGCP
jgi:pimeloyl-ACP methyl ester carboxylesterase